MSLKRNSILALFIAICTIVQIHCGVADQVKVKPRVLISSDIGGTDPDDYQSMIHLLMYADLFQLEGLVSSPYGPGRKKDFVDIIDLYEQDLPQLKAHSTDFPEPGALKTICKQGEIKGAPYKGYRSSTEGSDWIIQCAQKESDQALWVLVWGGLEDLAQALHDEPTIKDNIKVYWIGGPNKKWSADAYAYIAENHPDLWMIEANATYRGWFLDAESPEDISNDGYYDSHIQERGAMGKAFKDFYKGRIKMGDTPSLMYVLNGSPDDPLSESWGGRFTRIDRSSKNVFERNTTTADTVVAYSVLEWRFKGPELSIPQDSACFTMEIWNQVWPGYYLGDGNYGVRYSSKKPEIGTYVTSSDIPELDGHTGQYVSITPWPGEPISSDYALGSNWFGDRKESELFFGVQQGARTVSQYRKEFMLDWAKRWEWIN